MLKAERIGRSSVTLRGAKKIRIRRINVERKTASGKSSAAEKMKLRTVRGRRKDRKRKTRESRRIVLKRIGGSKKMPGGVKKKLIQTRKNKK